MAFSVGEVGVHVRCMLLYSTAQYPTEGKQRLMVLRANCHFWYSNYRGRFSLTLLLPLLGGLPRSYLACRLVSVSSSVLLALGLVSLSLSLPPYFSLPLSLPLPPSLFLSPSLSLSFSLPLSVSLSLSLALCLSLFLPLSLFVHTSPEQGLKRVAMPTRSLANVKLLIHQLVLRNITQVLKWCPVLNQIVE